MGGTRANKIFYRAMDATLSLVSAHSKGDGGKSGPMPHLLVCDEYHEFKESDVLDMYVAGTKSRRNPLVIITTNTGEGRNTPCGEEQAVARKVALGEIENDRYFPFVAVLDADDYQHDAHLNDESCWGKANPSLAYGLPGLEYLRDRAAEAKASTMARRNIDRLNFGISRDAFSRWIDGPRWVRAEVDDLTDALTPEHLAVLACVRSVGHHGPHRARRSMGAPDFPEQGTRIRGRRYRMATGRGR